MRVAIHQPHYFPWLGYFAKMAVSDKFILLDSVQFEKGSQMIRNQVLDSEGNKRFITIMGDTRGYLDKEYREIKTKNISDWTGKQLDALTNYYRYSRYRDETLCLLRDFFDNKFDTVCKWTCGSIFMIKDLLDIKTEIIYQSDLQYDTEQRKSDLVLELCKSIGANTYVSGRGGSMNYLNQDAFNQEGINVEFFGYNHPEYKQSHHSLFVPGVSCLDIFFNCGIDEAKNIFRESIGEMRNE